MGKYIRHLLGVVVGALVGGLVMLLKAQFGVEVPEDQVSSLVDALVAVLEPAAMLGGYAFTEKFLKRYEWLDLEGFIDRLWLKKEATVAERSRPL